MWKPVIIATLAAGVFASWQLADVRARPQGDTGLTDTATASGVRTQRLPNQLAVHDEHSESKLVGWSVAPGSIPGVKDLIVPDNPLFAGAASFHFTSRSKAGAEAAASAFKAVGLTEARVLASTACSRDAVRVLDAHPASTCHAVMVRGLKDGETYDGISLVLFSGSKGEMEGSGVHSFLAPRAVFEALGGNAIVMGRWMNASAAPGTNMLTTYGREPPTIAVKNLSAFFDRWAHEYVAVQTHGAALATLQIQQKTLEMMRSHSAATADCANYESCTVVDYTGQGDYVSEPR